MNFPNLQNFPNEHSDFYEFFQSSAQRVGFFNIGSGRVLEKIPGSGSGSGRVGVLKYKIGYFRVSFLLSGISGYSWVFSGISGCIRVYPGISGYFWVFQSIFDYIGYCVFF